MCESAEYEKGTQLLGYSVQKKCLDNVSAYT